MRRADLFQRVVFFFLCASIALVGIGRIEVPFLDLRFRSWSVSRATFFFWLIGKAVLWCREPRVPWELHLKSISTPLLVFAGWATASLFPGFTDTGDFRYLLFALGHYFMVVDCFNDDKKQSLLYGLLAITPGILLVRGIYVDPAILRLSLASRFAYPLAHPNPAGYLFAMSIPLCIAMMLGRSRWVRSLAVVSFLSQLGALILTFSRTAWIALCVSLVGVSVGEKRVRVIVAVLAVAGLVAFGVSSQLSDRVVSLFHPAADPHTIWRAHAVANAISVGLDHPFLGNGYGRDHLRAALEKKHPEFTARGFVPHSHNFYAELIAGVGFLGLAIFLWVLVSAGIQLIQKISTREAFAEERYTDLGLLVSLIAFAVAAMGDIAFYHHEPRIFFFTLLGLICLRLRP